jgi:hypothetical protein
VRDLGSGVSGTVVLAHRDGSGIAVAVTDLVDGVSLRTLLDRRHTRPLTRRPERDHERNAR